MIACFGSIGLINTNAWKLVMKNLLLTSSIAALLLATGTAHAQREG
jgi:hypothetical protein